MGAQWTLLSVSIFSLVVICKNIMYSAVESSSSSSAPAGLGQPPHPLHCVRYAEGEKDVEGLDDVYLDVRWMDVAMPPKRDL